MTDHILIDTAEIPGGGHLYLVQSGEDYEIVLNDEQLMGNWATRSEQALATLVCDRMPKNARLLIGGLGMGFTLRAALSASPDCSAIFVAELVPKIVTWATGPLAHIFAGSLNDPRVEVELRDVHDVIAERRDAFDAILLDVDNGPDGLVSLANERLYCNWGLRTAHAALRPGGILAIWSAYPDADFTARLGQAGFQVEEVVVTASDVQGDEERHTIWLATRAD